MMSGSAYMFYAISAMVLGTGLLAVTTRKIFRAAVWLLFSLIGIAALYFWLELEFLAAVQITVYVGGIVVLIIFSIFLTQASGERMAPTPMRRMVFSVLAALSGFFFVFSMISQFHFAGRESASLNSSVALIGAKMLDAGPGGYVLPFEVVSVLLLAAMIGCIVIAMKSKPEQA